MQDSARRFGLGCIALLTLVTSSSSLLHAQDDGPPNVLVVHREYLKPGKGGTLHERSESAFVRAFADAKFSTHYFALEALSGPARSLFLLSYGSFADWEKDNAAMRANKTLGAAIDRATLSDGDLLESYDSMALSLRRDLSLNQGHILGARYFEISTYVVKPGHVQDFEELAHLYADGFRKAAPDTHWDCFQVMYGSPIAGASGGDVFVVMNLMKSLAEVDRGSEDFKKLAAVLGSGGMKKLGELTAASVATTTTNLFEINPRMSYPVQDWIDKEPSFWKVAPPSMTKKPVPRPATP